MTTLMEDGLDMLVAEDSSVTGGRIMYQRGEAVVWIDAGFGRTEFQVESNSGVSIEYSDRDFRFPANALILGGSRVVPERGDRITIVEEDHVDKQVFEVLAPLGLKVYHECDPQGYRIRVHTKRLS